eukprot:scaffold168915_cov66-Attheya_sp.AAC.1
MLSSSPGAKNNGDDIATIALHLLCGSIFYGVPPKIGMHKSSAILPKTDTLSVFNSDTKKSLF